MTLVVRIISELAFDLCSIAIAHTHMQGLYTVTASRVELAQNTAGQGDGVFAKVNAEFDLSRYRKETVVLTSVFPCPTL